MILKNEIDKVLKILKINKPKFIKNKYMAFSYVPKIDTIFYYDYEYNKTLFLIIHELRHKYQYVYNKNIFTYNKYYYNSVSELDAYYFSYYVIRNIFNINYELSFPLNDILREYINECFIKDMV